MTARGSCYPSLAWQGWMNRLIEDGEPGEAEA